MTATTLPGVLLKGVAGSRPAANAVAAGSLYSATDTGAITQSDGVSTWSAYATITAGNLTGDVTSVGLATTIGAGKVTEAMQVLANNTTQNVTTAKHGYAPILPNDATKYLDGTGAYTVPAGGGGSFTHSYLGYNTVGGSTETMTARRVYCKKITPASSGLLVNIAAYWQMDGADHIPGVYVAIFADNSNKPGQMIAANVSSVATVLLEAALASPTQRWFAAPVTAYLTGSTDYWIGFMATVTAGNPGVITYDGSGSDQYFTTGGDWIADGGTLYAITTSSNKYSIRASILT